MTKYPELKALFQRRLHELSLRDGVNWTLREIAMQIDEPETSVNRWANGAAIPQRLGIRVKLAEILGPETWSAMGLLPPDVDPAFLRLLHGAQKDPNLKKILDEALSRASEYHTRSEVNQLSFA